MNGDFNYANWQEALVSAVQNTLLRFLYFIPNLITAFALFLIGLILGGWAKRLTIRGLNALRFSAMVRKSGFQQFLNKAEITLKIEEIIGGLVKWLIVLVFFVASVNVLGLTTVNRILDSVLAYLPNVFSAVIILTIGILTAGVVESLIKGALFNIDVKAARLLAKVGSYLVVVFTILTAISELGIAQAFISTLFIGFIAMLSLGFGLAIGLGSKDLVGRLLNEWYANLKKEISKKSK